jgi:hypothetical protein
MLGLVVSIFYSVFGGFFCCFVSTLGGGVMEKILYCESRNCSLSGNFQYLSKPKKHMGKDLVCPCRKPERPHTFHGFLDSQRGGATVLCSVVASH